MFLGFLIFCFFFFFMGCAEVMGCCRRGVVVQEAGEGILQGVRVVGDRRGVM